MDNYKQKNYEELKELEDQNDIDNYFQNQTTYQFAKQKLEIINNFNDDFSFLNNSYPSEVYYQGKIYPCVFNAFQAARTNNDFFKKLLQKSQTPEKIYEIAIQINNPKDWNLKRLLIMEKLIRDKFIRNKNLKKKLVDTNKRELKNSFSIKTSSNLFWGVYKNEGQNHLGKILTRVREDSKNSEDFNKWLRLSFNLPEKNIYRPKFKIQFYNEELFVSMNLLEDKSYYLIGSGDDCDVVVANEGVLEKHVVLLFDCEFGVVVVDLSNLEIVTVEEKKAFCFVPVFVKGGEFGIGFGGVVRLRVKSDFGEMKRFLVRKKSELEKRVCLLEEDRKVLFKEDSIIGKYVKRKIKSRRVCLIKNFRDNLGMILKNLYSERKYLKEIILPYNEIVQSYKSYIFLIFDSSHSAKKVRKNSKKYKDPGLEDLEKINKENKSAFKKYSKKHIEKSIFVTRIKNRDFLDLFRYFLKFGIVQKIIISSNHGDENNNFAFIEFFSEKGVKNSLEYYDINKNKDILQVKSVNIIN